MSFTKKLCSDCRRGFCYSKVFRSFFRGSGEVFSLFVVIISIMLNFFVDFRDFRAYYIYQHGHVTYCSKVPFEALAIWSTKFLEHLFFIHLIIQF